MIKPDNKIILICQPRIVAFTSILVWKEFYYRGNIKEMYLFTLLVVYLIHPIYIQYYYIISTQCLKGHKLYFMIFLNECQIYDGFTKSPVSNFYLFIGVEYQIFNKYTINTSTRKLYSCLWVWFADEVWKWIVTKKKNIIICCVLF